MKRLVSLRGLLAVGLFVMLTFTSLVFVGGIAKANNWTGRAQYYGYFDNKYGKSDSPYPDKRGPVIDNNDYASPSIPYSVNTKQELYNYLENKYRNPGTFGHPAWDKAGASFVVNTMIGLDPNQASRNVTNAMWDELHDKLFAQNVTLTYDTTVSASAYGNVNTYFQYVQKDVAWYSDSTESGRAIVIRSKGKVVYVLLYKCANPLGNLAGLPDVPHWTVATATTAKKTQSTTTPPLAANEVIPGNTITWTHTIKNNGPDATDDNVAWRYNNSGLIGGSGGNRTFTSNKANGADDAFQSTYQAKDADLGKQVCRSTWAQPHAWNDDGATESGRVCFNVVYRYELHPSVTVGSTTAEAGADGITVAYDLSNGGPTTSKPSAWQLTECRYNPGATPPASNGEITNGATGAATFGAGGTCNVKGSGTGTYTVGGHHLGDTTASTATLNAGSHICYVLSVNPPSATAGGWRHSVLTCITVLKSPKLQAYGGDVRADTIAVRQATNLGGRYYGSWSEYGIFGINAVKAMASGGALAGGGPTNNASKLTSLTFANTPTLGSFYSQAPAAGAYYDAYQGKADETTGSTTRGGPVNNGTHTVVKVNGDLVINSDITYSGTYASAADVPRVIYVVSGNIIVNANVGWIDAWLIAKGTLYTCNDDAGANRRPLTVDICTNQLTFNGPVNVANTRLSRTFGADGNETNRAAAAEVFNLAPSNYLSNYNASISASNIQTVYEKELPPRW